jgi:hypothetical protein
VLGRRFGDSSARGFDATFSAPKSVSALWGLTPDPFVRAEVLAAHDAAVDAALGWFEAHGAVTRRGRDGVETSFGKSPGLRPREAEYIERYIESQNPTYRGCCVVPL